jgi:hypothetical protein
MSQEARISMLISTAWCNQDRDVIMGDSRFRQGAENKGQEAGKDWHLSPGPGSVTSTQSVEPA